MSAPVPGAIRTEREGARLTLVIDRPGAANALSRAMLVALAEKVEAAAHDRAVRVIVLTGAGERAFSSGADLAEARATPSLTRDPVWERLSGALASAPQLTLAALNGTLAGGAFGMALACDLRLAVPEASFFYPVLRNGFLPQPSDPARLAALVGPGRAREILLCGARWSADEAHEAGLIERVVPRTRMEDEIAALAADALAAPTDLLSGIKALFARLPGPLSAMPQPEINP
ncbi:MAG: enoyl-CoA hydratase/isomerase family protein [Rhodobacteraceae bacterium]|nr:enoyl-CoA hydratase/isomerase family protein [Paracoccaceae bacterium]